MNALSEKHRDRCSSQSVARKRGDIRLKTEVAVQTSAHSQGDLGGGRMPDRTEDVRVDIGRRCRVIIDRR